jgi:hypothetical protein
VEGAGRRITKGLEPMMTDPRIVTHDFLMLNPKEGFLFGVACILGAIWFALVMVRRLPLLLRDVIALFKDERPKVVQIDEHRRRMQLDAAAGRRAS